MLGINEEVFSCPSKKQILTFVLQNCKKSAVKHLKKKLCCLILLIYLHYFIQGCRHTAILISLMTKLL